MSAPSKDVHTPHAETRYGRSLWDNLEPWLSMEWPELRVILAYGIGSSLFSLAVPIAAQSVVNTVAFTGLWQPMVILALSVLGLLGVSAALRMIQTYLVEVLQQRLFVRVAIDLAYRLTRLRADTLDQHRGDLIATRFFEVVSIQKSFSSLILDATSIVLQAIMAMVLLAFYHPILLAFDLLLIAVIAVGVLWPARRAMRTAVQESIAKYHVAEWLVELGRQPAPFKIGGAHRFAMNVTDHRASEYVDARKRHFRYLLGQIGIALGVQAFMSALLLGIGGYLVIRQQLTLGQLVAAEIVVTIVVSSFAKFGKYLESFYDLVASVEKLEGLFGLSLERSGGDTLAHPRTTGIGLKVHNLSYTYPHGKKRVLTQVHLNVAPGQRVGINGTNGSGKSTLLDLISGLRGPDGGTIEIDDRDLRDLDLENFRSEIAWVRPDGIFEGTVLDNVQVGRPHVQIEHVRAALDQVGMLQEVMAHPDGLQAALTGSSHPFSGGQLQRMLIARALAGRPRLLLLDEAFESVDAEIRDQILDAVYDRRHPWTVVSATHDSFELSRCDAVYRLEQGVLIGDERESP